MTQREPSVADKTRALVEAGRALDEPSTADRERVRARLTAALGAAAVATTASKAAANSGTGAALYTAGAGIGTTKLLGSLGAALALAAAASGLIWLRGTPQDPRASSAPAASALWRLAAKTTATSGAKQRSDTPSLDSPTAPEPTAARRAPPVLEPNSADRVTIVDPSQRLAMLRPGASRQRASLERQALPRDPKLAEHDASAFAAENATRTTSPQLALPGTRRSSAAARALPDAHAAATTATRTDAPPSTAVARAAVGTPADPPPSAAEARAAVGTSANPSPSAAEAPPPPTAASSPSLAGELALLDAAQRALASGELERALRQLDQHAARFPSGGLVPERLAARAVTLCRMQRNGEGLRELQRLKARAPTSPLLAWARESCGSHAAR